MANDAIDLASIRRVLVTKLRHHGDVLLTSPVFTVLKNHVPHAELDALVYSETREMLTLHPAISNVYAIDREWKRRGLYTQLRAERALLAQLKARGYDLLIHLTESARGIVLGQLLRPRYAVARDFTDKRGVLWRRTFTHLFNLPAKPRHTVEWHLDALRALGVHPREDERALTLVPGDAAEQRARELLRERGVEPGKFIHLHPASRWLFKCWPVEKYAALLDALRAQGETVVMTAAPDRRELSMVQDILARVRRPAVDLSGQLTLKELAALSRAAKCFVGVDSVPMHIASAMQRPVVALFGPSGDQEWGPWRTRHEVVAMDYSCRPCGRDGCAGSKVSDCLVSLPVERVLGAIRRMLAHA